ncbi:helix-hairpin-helix domain-containing protein [Streptomyces avermitilis]|uniref:helix-hairpin-helix domain-containing protein n=1 Tax=Streptomyces TaxID=1883 RepID=UPI0002D88D15|nr:helix-hairpin-helix domain-containing protein [Streptomyces avermitilis]MYT02181.1 DNA helicase RecD [Streptomyces sp. SID5469]
MTTEPETTDEAEPGQPGAGAGEVEPGQPGAGAVDGVPETEGTPGSGAAGDAESSAEGTAGSEAAGATESSEGTAGSEAAGTAEGSGDAAKPTEAEAELAAQRVERERIERRKAEKQAPIEAGTKLSGTAADLLAAVRVVESGAKPVASAFSEPPAPRRPAPEPERRPEPVAAPAGPAVPAAQAVAGVRAVLTEGGAPEALAPQLAALLGDGADLQLREDPWQLLRVSGVRPEQADGFARALLGAECGPDDERRGRAVTVWLLEQAALAGHTALEVAALTTALAQRAVPDPDTAVQSALAEGEVLVFQDALDAAAPAAEAEAEEEGAERPVRVLIGLERYALAEESLADALGRVMNSVPKEDGSAADWERAAASAGGSAAELIRAVAGHGLVLHTGGDASGAEAAALLSAARGLGLRTWAAAHSRIGCDRFTARLAPSDLPGGPQQGPGTGVSTVAGLLSGAEGPGRDADGALVLDLLVVLDAPQLDVETAAMLAESLPDGARLVLSGDPGVLWSAGPGRVFADLLAARVCPGIASRTPDPGPIGELISGIGVGELNQVEAPGKEVVIVPVRDAGEAVHRTVQLVADSVPRALGVPAEQTQVITPGHGGAAGTRALNAALKERLNPGPGRFGGFDPGDRIAYSPAPGRTLPGRVVKADADGLHLEIPGAPVVVPKERVEQCVRHGWALTAHQAVGSRWPAAVVVLPGDAAQSLTRPWVYTAFGLAERHLSVVHGVEQALPRAVAEVTAKPRTTRLPALLRPQVPAAD